MYTAEQLQKLDRKEIQAVAKKFGISPLNGKSEDLIIGVLKSQAEGVKPTAENPIDSNDSGNDFTDEDADQKTDETVRNNEDENSNVPTDDQPTDTDEEYDLALVVDRYGKVVRTFSLRQNFENFAEIAQEYANKRGLEVQMRMEDSGFTCPHCGQVIELEE